MRSFVLFVSVLVGSLAAPLAAADRLQGFGQFDREWIDDHTEPTGFTAWVYKCAGADVNEDPSHIAMGSASLRLETCLAGGHIRLHRDFTIPASVTEVRVRAHLQSTGDPGHVLRVAVFNNEHREMADAFSYAGALLAPFEAIVPVTPSGSGGETALRLYLFYGAAGTTAAYVDALTVEPITTLSARTASPAPRRSRP